MNKKGHPATLTAPKWKKGQSGNPGGRPKKLPVTDHLWSISEEEVPPALLRRFGNNMKLKFPPKTTYARVWAVRQSIQAGGLKADTGATRALKEIADRTEGKPAQRIILTGPEQTVATISLVFDRKKPKSFEEST